MSQIVDPVGLTTTFTYTGNYITSITDPSGRMTQMTYDAAGNLLSITDPDGSQNIWEYDDKHHMIAHTNPQGERGTDSYDFAGRVSGAVRKDGSVVKIQPVAVQGLYRPEQTIDPIIAPPIFELGVPIASQIDGNGNISSVLLDQFGQLVNSSDGVGQLSSVSRDNRNLKTKTTDARGNQTYYQYDAQGNLIASYDSLSATVLGSTSTNYTSLFSNPIYPLPLDVNIRLTGDINEDGNLDVLGIGSAVSLLLGDGKGGFTGPEGLSIYLSQIDQEMVPRDNQC